MSLFGWLGLLSPGALWAFAILPALLGAYLARERPRQATVSSVLALRALHVMRGQRFGGRPRLTWTFFLELLALALAALATAGPYVLSRGAPIAIVLDNSAPMEALTPAGKTRFETAVAAVDKTLGASGAGTATVYLTAPQPRAIGGALDDVGAARAAIAHAHPVDAPDDPAALATLLGQLNADGRLGRIIYAGYRPIAPPAPARFRQIAVAEPIPNYAIGRFTLSRETFGAAELHASLTVANLSPAPATMKVALEGDGKPLGTEQARVAAGATAMLEFPQLPASNVYRAELAPSDGFMLDNVAYATGSSVRPIEILFVSPTPADGASLSGIPGIAVTARTPDQYTPRDVAACDVAIFEYAAPKELPAVNTLLVMPPPGDPVFRLSAAAAARIEIANWPAVNPLTDGVNFRLLNIRSGEYFGVHPWLNPVVSGPGGGLLLSGVRGGHRYIVAGFNPFPYLGRGNLPMSILTLNLLSELAGLGAHAGGYRTGEAWIVPAGVTRIITPAGDRVPVTAGALYTASAQGVYQLARASGAPALRAVNLSDLGVSDLQNVPPIAIAPAPQAAASGGSAVRQPLTPYLIAAILGLIVFESLFVYRRRQAAA